MRRLDLRSLHFGDASEASRTVSVDVDPFALGGFDYAVSDDAVALEVTASRVGSRMTVHGDGRAVVHGPCQRCLVDAEVPVEIAAVDYVREGESEGPEDDAYVRGGVLDLAAWVRDAIADGLTGQVLCREDCRGLCPVCGADLNESTCPHAH
jgi:uncharacterized protein